MRPLGNNAWPVSEDGVSQGSAVLPREGPLHGPGGEGPGLCEPVRRAGGSSAWCGLLTLAQGYPGEAGVQLPDCQEAEPWCEPRKPQCMLTAGHDGHTPFDVSNSLKAGAQLVCNFPSLKRDTASWYDSRAPWKPRLKANQKRKITKHLDHNYKKQGCESLPTLRAEPCVLRAASQPCPAGR